MPGTGEGTLGQSLRAVLPGVLPVECSSPEKAFAGWFVDRVELRSVVR